MKLNIYKIFLLVFLITGCSHIARIETNFKQLGETNFSPLQPSDQVSIYIKEDVTLSESAKVAIDRQLLSFSSIPPHEVVGEIIVHAAPAASAKRIFNNAIEKARAVGADAIIVTSVKDRQSYGFVSGKKLGNMKSHHLYVTAVKILQKK